MRLHPEHVALAIADRRDVVRRAARIPRVAGVSPSIVDEAEHDLIVVDEFLQHFLFAVLRKEELAFRMSRDERDDSARFHPAREDAGAAVLQFEEARAAFVLTGVVTRADGLRRGRHRRARSGASARPAQAL